MKITVLAECMLLTACLAKATSVQQLFFDAGARVTATIDVDALGFVTCVGSCGTLQMPIVIQPHGSLSVSGSIGQFTINVLGGGGLATPSPTVQHLNQVISANTGAGSLTIRFTETEYCAAIPCFGTKFVLAGAAVNGLTSSSTILFSTLVYPINSIPAKTLVGSLPSLTGLADAASHSFPNPIKGKGSLTSTATIHFTGKGTVQAILQVGTPTSSSVPTALMKPEQCLTGGWATIVRSDGTSFANQADCLQYFSTW